MHFFLLLNTIKILYFVDDQFWFPLTSMVLFFPYNGGHWEPKLLVTNIIQNHFSKKNGGHWEPKLLVTNIIQNHFLKKNGGHWEPKLLVTNIIQNIFFKKVIPVWKDMRGELTMTEFKFSFIKNPKDSL